MVLATEQFRKSFFLNKRVKAGNRRPGGRWGRQVDHFSLGMEGNFSKKKSVERLKGGIWK